MPRKESIDIVPKPEVEDLYRDFTSAFEKLGDCFFGDPKALDKYIEMTEDPYLRLVPRAPMYKRLLKFNKSLDAPDAVIQNVRALKRDSNYVVLVWQHPYLLGGPFETFLKVSTAILLCRRLNELGKGNFVPVVWCETDYHDLEEINRMFVLDAGGELHPEQMQIDETERPSYDVGTGAAYEDLVARLQESMPDTEHSEWLFSLLGRSQGENLGEHFCRFMLEVFGEYGLVVATPELFRKSTGKLIARAIENPDETVKLLEQGKQALEAKGYSTDYLEWSEPLDLFYLDGSVRRKLTYANGAFAVEGTGRSMTPKEVASGLKREPEKFSTGVWLSPVAQDHCLPCVAHVAGAGGVCFFGVQKPLFDTLYVAFPQIVPQVSATFVDKASEALLKKKKTTVKKLIEEFGAEGGGSLKGEGPAAKGDKDAKATKAPRKRAKSKSKQPEPKPEPIVAPVPQEELDELRTEALTAFDSWRASLEKRSTGILSKIAGLKEELASMARGIPASVKLPKTAKARTLKAFDAYAAAYAKISETHAAGFDKLRKQVDDVLAIEVDLPELAAHKRAIEAAIAGLEQVGAYQEPKHLAGVASVLEPALADLERQAHAAFVEAETKRRSEAASKPTTKKPRAKKRKAGASGFMNVLVPRGGLQEDTLATIHFLNEYGPTLFEATLDHLDPLDFLHQVVYLGK